MTNFNEKARIRANVDAGVYDKNPAEFEESMEVYYCFQKLSPKTKALIHSLAYEMGHQFGYAEVFNHYPELVELAWCGKANG